MEEQNVRVQPGEVIARRYRVDREVPCEVDGIVRLLGVDTRLGRAVTVDLIEAVAPSTVIDAALRTKLVADRRIAKVLEARVERDGEHRSALVVSVRPTGTQLQALLLDGPVPAADAVAMLGQAAAGLRAAAGQGLRHGALRAEHIWLADTGAVTITGAGYEAEAISQHGAVALRRERDDAVALASLLLLAVTGRADAGIDDLPDDLADGPRALCEAVLDGSGPTTLAEVGKALGSASARSLRAAAGELAERSWPATAVVVAAEQVAADALADLAAEQLLVPEAALATEAPLHEEEGPAATEAAEAEAPAPDLADADLADADLVDADQAPGRDLATLDDDAETGVDLAEPTTEEIPLVEAEPVADEPLDLDSTALERPRTRFGGAVDDIDEFYDIVAERSVPSDVPISVIMLDRLHDRFPRVGLLGRLRTALTTHAAEAPRFNPAPLLVAFFITTVFVIVMIAAHRIQQPIDPVFDEWNNPPQQYPEYTFGVDPTPSPSAD